jgi:uncharacterized membrane protein
MKKPYGKLLAVVLQITILILCLKEEIITSPESELDFYIAILFITLLMFGIIGVLFLMVEDILNNQRKKDND